MHLLWFLVPLYFYGRLLTCNAYLTSIAIAELSPSLKSTIGGGIHVSGPPFGSALRRYGSDFAEWSVSLKGSTGSGRLYGVANEIDGTWEFSRLSFLPTDASHTIDLTPAPARLNLAAPEKKNIYLVPLDLNPEQSLNWAAGYYQSLLGVDIRILPPLVTRASEFDNNRGQLIAEKCIERIARAYPDLAADPSNILVAVTSRDIFIKAYDWKYAENFRQGGRFAIVSSARLKPADFPGKWNKELLNSRLQKMLSKDLAILYFALPLSNDYTSLLSAGVLSGREIDYMSDHVVGAKNRWDPMLDYGDPMVALNVAVGKPVVWGLNYVNEPLPDFRMEHFAVDLSLGLFIQRRLDFYLDGEYPLEFTRAYRTADDISRPFGVGSNNTLDIFLVGQMESYIDLISEEGGRIHFEYANTTAGDRGNQEHYRPRNAGGGFNEAVYEAAGVWRLTTTDGWTYLFPYRPKARGAHVTVLTGFIDPKGRKTEMVRNSDGDLLTVTTPERKWLHFDYDQEHRIVSITDSSGRSVRYSYDVGGRLVRTTDSAGNSAFYEYNTRNEMVSVTEGVQPILSNIYGSNAFITSQTLADGRQFGFSYSFGSHMAIDRSTFTDPNGRITTFTYGSNGYVQSLPMRRPY